MRVGLVFCGYGPEVGMAKLLEVARELLPMARVAGVLIQPSADPGFVREGNDAASALGLGACAQKKEATTTTPSTYSK